MGYALNRVEKIYGDAPGRKLKRKTFYDELRMAYLIGVKQAACDMLKALCLEGTTLELLQGDIELIAVNSYQELRKVNKKLPDLGSVEMFRND